MTDTDIIEVVAAHAAGKTIQSRGRFESGDWKNNNHPEWQFGTTDYRVAPEPRKPREFWLIQDKSAPIYKQPYFMAYGEHQYGCDSNDQIHVREVVDPDRDLMEWWVELLSEDGKLVQIFTHPNQKTRGGKLIKVREVAE